MYHMLHCKSLAILISCFLESQVDSKNGSLHKCSIIEVTQNKDTKHEQSTSSADITSTESLMDLALQWLWWWELQHGKKDSASDFICWCHL